MGLETIIGITVLVVLTIGVAVFLEKWRHRQDVATVEETYAINSSPAAILISKPDAPSVLIEESTGKRVELPPGAEPHPLSLDSTHIGNGVFFSVPDDHDLPPLPNQEEAYITSKIRLAAFDGRTPLEFRSPQIDEQGKFNGIRSMHGACPLGDGTTYAALALEKGDQYRDLFPYSVIVFNLRGELLHRVPIGVNSAFSTDGKSRIITNLNTTGLGPQMKTELMVLDVGQPAKTITLSGVLMRWHTNFKEAMVLVFRDEKDPRECAIEILSIDTQETLHSFSSAKSPAIASMGELFARTRALAEKFRPIPTAMRFCALAHLRVSIAPDLSNIYWLDANLESFVPNVQLFSIDVRERVQSLLMDRFSIPQPPGFPSNRWTGEPGDFDPAGVRDCHLLFVNREKQVAVLGLMEKRYHIDLATRTCSRFRLPISDDSHAPIVANDISPDGSRLLATSGLRFDTTYARPREVPQPGGKIFVCNTQGDPIPLASNTMWSKWLDETRVTLGNEKHTRVVSIDTLTAEMYR